MVRPLEESMSWSELCDYTISRLGTALMKAEHKKFQSWFMEREGVGYLFDHVLIYRCFRIWEDMNNDLDHFIVISGREGFGKSTLSIQIASWVCPDFNITNIVYGSQRYLDIMKRKLEEYRKSGMLKHESLVLDEGTEIISRESLNNTNITLMKTFFVQRALHFLVLVNIPNFHMLDSVLRMHRVRTLIEVIGKGKYKCITGKGIKIIVKDGMRTKDINSVRVPQQYWWTGYFRKPFPKNVDYATYQDHKITSMEVLIDNMRTEDVKAKFVQVSHVSKAINLSPEMIRRRIVSGELKGKKVGGRWLVSREAYEKLLESS